MDILYSRDGGGQSHRGPSVTKLLLRSFLNHYKAYSVAYIRPAIATVLRTPLGHHGNSQVYRGYHHCLQHNRVWTSLDRVHRFQAPLPCVSLSPIRCV